MRNDEAPVVPPVSRWFQRGDEACRLHAIRPKVSLDAEHPGRLRTSLQPVIRGVVVPEWAARIGWCTPEEIDAYAQFILAQGWVEVARIITHGICRKTITTQLEMRLERLRSYQARGLLSSAGKERAAIRSLCLKHGLLVPAEAELRPPKAKKKTEGC